MIIKIITNIYAKVADEAEGEAASSLIDNGLLNAMGADEFPYGEIITVDVDHFKEATAEEVETHNLDYEEDLGQ